MRSAPGFWWRRQPGVAALALSPIAWIFAASSVRRMTQAPGFVAPVPVICVGNFVVGGAGKTPTALALARIARDVGFTPGFLASGYGGKATGARLVDPGGDRASLVGDEALLLAAAAPTVIGRDRGAAARRLLATGIDLVIMDDGFQNPSLAKDLSFVVVDADAGIGNGRVLPAGPLRAPLAPQLARADAIIVIGDGGAAAPVAARAGAAGRPVLQARLVPAGRGGWRERPILAFAGIGRPEKLYASLKAVGATVAETASFADHHRYSEAEAGRLIAQAAAADLRLVTTEKDKARLVGEAGALARLREQADAFPVVLEFVDATAVTAMIRQLAQGRRQ